MNSLSPDQLNAMVGAMQQHEGYTGANTRNILNIGDPLSNYRIEFDPNDPTPGDDQDNGVGTGQRGETSSPVPASFTVLDGGEKTYKISDDGVDLAGQELHVNANNINITLESNSLANISGTGDTINLQGSSNETIGITGQNLTVVGDSGNDVVNLNAGTSATVDGGGYAGIVGDNATLTFGDGGSALQTTPGVQNETVNGSNLSITLNANVQMTINGSNDTINGMAGQDNVTINGSDNSFSGANDQVNLEGDEGSDTETGQNDSYFSNGTYIGGSDPSGGTDDPGDPGDDGDDDDPLVLNLRGGSVDTVAAAHSPARFDFHPNGKAVQTGWGTPGEGYLVDAADGQTTVRDGSDLVSSFMSLQKLDSNHDDRIDAKDAHWNDLKVWVDDTGTATSQPGSLRSLSDLGITSIDLDPTPDRHRQNGNLILSEGMFTRRDGSTGQIADVDFRTDAGSPQPEKAGSPGAAANLQASTQAAQLVAAMSTFGATSAAETPAQGLDRPAPIAMGVDAGHPAHRHAA